MTALSLSTKQTAQLARDAACMTLAQHVRARLAQAGRELARGTPEATAERIVSRWSGAGVLAFYMLAREERFVAHGALAAKCGGTKKAIRDWWRRLQGTSVRVAPLDGGAEPGRIDLFKRGRECFYASQGVKLQLNTEKLPFALARHVTESTLGHVLAVRVNYAGACEALEADATKSAEERAAARRHLLEDEGRKAGAVVSVPSDEVVP
jgi:hypothetical protein